MTHAHRHGDHEHRHDHAGSATAHSHGWHSPPATCTGDNVFGKEEETREPSTNAIRAQLAGWPTVIVPYVPEMLHYEAAMRGRLVDVSGSEWDYWELLRQRWDHGTLFVVVEQDMAPTKVQVDDLIRCWRPWCVYDYHVREGLGSEIAPWVGMGVVKFGARLFVAAPKLVENLGPTTWSRLDEEMGRALLRLFPPHIHEPPVEHLHDYHR